MFTQALRWSIIGGVFAIPVVLPFIVSATMFFPYITGKNFTFRIIVELIFAAWVLLAFYEPRYRPRFSWVLSAIVLFLVIVGLADLFGVNSFKSFWSNFERMEGYIALLHLFAYFLVASTVLNTEKLWTAFWYCSLGVSVAIAFIGLKPVLGALSQINHLPRIDATFGNPIYLAVYCLFHIFIALVLMNRWRGTHWHQVILGAVALLHIITMVLTMTRGTVLGFVGGAVITTVLVALLERERKALRGVAVGALVALVLVVSGAYLVKDTEWAKTTPVVSRFTQMSLGEGTINARFMNWGMAWEGVKESPLLGYGQDNYEYVFSKHFDPMMYGQEPWFDRTHNIVFDWLIAAGFAGLIAYFLIPTALLTHLWVIDPHERRWSWRSLVSFSALRTLMEKRDDAFPATERALWTGLLAAYTFHNLFVFDNIISYILYFSVLAYLHMRVTEGHAPLWEGWEIRRETVTAVALPVVLVAGGVVLWYVNMPGIQTSKLLISALMPQERLADGRVVPVSPEQSLEYYQQALAVNQLGRQEVREQLAQRAAQIARAEGVSNETKKAYMDLAVAEVEREATRNADSARIALFLGSTYVSAGRMEDAERAFERALELTPTKQTAIFQLAEVKGYNAKQQESVELFKRAYELVPEYDDARTFYAASLIRSGRDKEAVDLLTERYGTAAVDDERLYRAWTQAKRYDVVATLLEARIEKNPDDLQQRISLAAAYKELGRVPEAVALLEKIKVDHPEYAEQLDGFIKEVRGAVR